MLSFELLHSKHFFLFSFNFMQYKSSRAQMVVTIKSYLYALSLCQFCLIINSVIQQNTKDAHIYRKLFSHRRLLCQPKCAVLPPLLSLGICKLLVCCGSWSTLLLPNYHFATWYSKWQRVIANKTTELLHSMNIYSFYYSMNLFLLYTKQKTLEAYTLECITKLKLIPIVENLKIFNTVTQLSVF